MYPPREVKGRQKKKPDAKKGGSGPAKGGNVSKHLKSVAKGGGARTGARR